MRKLLAITLAVAVTACSTSARNPASNATPTDDFYSTYAASLPDLQKEDTIKSYILSLGPPPADAPRYPEIIHTQLTDRQKLTIEQITSIFENSTPVFQYDYIEDIGDGAGVTAGRIGFTTAGHDLQQLVMQEALDSLWAVWDWASQNGYIDEKMPGQLDDPRTPPSFRMTLKIEDRPAKPARP